ncbi:MAG: diaminopimelate epimerase [Sedimentisphaerales bacterium]
MNIHFKKYHGLGNDYLVIDPNVFDLTLTPEIVRLICDRHFGVGADGILYGPIIRDDFFSVRIFNPDGSEAEKSGNGLRIFAKYLFEHNYVHQKYFRIQTLGGIVELFMENVDANLIKINMGKITFISTEIPVEGKTREVMNEELEINGSIYKMTCLSIGNPHCVIPMKQISEEKARELGPFIENLDLFPHRINIQLLKIIDEGNIEIQIWERGAGYTLASGSSSCAAAGAAHKLGLVGNKVNVKMPGGKLLVEISETQEAFLTGPAEGIFEGSFQPDFLRKLL